MEVEKRQAEILFIQMGGTIDKTYPKTKNGYSFEIGDPAFQKILAKIRPGLAFKYKTKTVCQKDSQEIDSSDRYKSILHLFRFITPNLIFPDTSF